MLPIAPLQPEDLSQTLELVNLHIASVVPGWALSEPYFSAALERYPREYIIDPWVIRRRTLRAVEHDRIVAAAHLLAYGDGPQVSDDYHRTGEIAWLVFHPGNEGPAAGLLEACHKQIADWGLQKIFAWSTCLPAPVMNGIAGAWPHIQQLFTRAGYSPLRGENIYGGRIDTLPPPGAPPLDGLHIQRRVGRLGVRFAAVHGADDLGFCDCMADLSNGGELSSLRGWSEIADLRVQAGFRSQGIGRWLVLHAVEWMQLAGCDRVVIAVDVDDESAGAGPFYRRFGWRMLDRQLVGWQKPA